MLHRKAALSAAGGVLLLEAGEVVVFQTLRERRTDVRRHNASVHRDRIAHDGRRPTDSCVGALGIRMIAARVLGERRLAAERFAAAGHKALVRTSARVDSAVTR